ncbi:MAG: hypothetical protein IKR95_06170 [Oscillospiraceae bacterium]|nr:hypothetical protein [Oscillospiraceae bacterium]
MQYVIRAYDGTGMLEKRMAVRPRHLENMAKVNGKVICAGGILDGEGKMKGSLLIMDFDSREGLDSYLKSEPYIIENVWQKIDIDPMNVVILNGEKTGK